MFLLFLACPKPVSQMMRNTVGDNEGIMSYECFLLRHQHQFSWQEKMDPSYTGKLLFHQLLTRYSDYTVTGQ